MGSTNIKMFGFGFVSGMRTTFSPAILSNYLRRKSSRSLKNSKLGFMRSPTTAVITTVLAAGEIYGDKLPTTPSRIAFPGILGRIASGAFAGAVIAENNRDSIWRGVLLGAAGAVVGSYACYHIRVAIDKLPGVKDGYVGAAEDLLTVAVGVGLLQ